MTLPTCHQRGAETTPGRYECRSNRLVHTGNVAAFICLRCPFADLPNVEIVPAVHVPMPEPVDTDCRHRGDLLRIGACDLCGVRGQAFHVLACDVHGECSMHRKHSAVRSCLTCADREAGE